MPIDVHEDRQDYLKKKAKTYDSTEIWLRGREFVGDMLQHKLFHIRFDFRVPHDERNQSCGHVKHTESLGRRRISATEISMERV